MEERSIRSRRPLRDNNPSHGSPIRRRSRHLSPNHSGSDHDEAERDLMEFENYPDATASSISTVNSSPDVADGDSVQYSYSRTQRNLKYDSDGNLREVNEITSKSKFRMDKKEGTSNYGLRLFASVVIATVSVLLFMIYSRNVTAESGTRQEIRCSFQQSELEFPNQNAILWKSLQHGVESVLNDIPTSPSIFLLAYDDVNSVKRITHSIVQRTTECMNSNVNALELSPADLAYDEMKSDYGVVIKKYQNQLKNSGVMLVNDLNKVPTEVAPAFHTFCDVHNPLVDRSIIFLTLQLSQHIHSGSNTNALQLVENYLRSNWSDLESFILEPLIVRVTDQVFVLNKEQ